MGLDNQSQNKQDNVDSSSLKLRRTRSSSLRGIRLAVPPFAAYSAEVALATKAGKASGGSPTEARSASEGWWQPAFVIFTQVSGWIAGPIILALFLGKWLDNKYQTEPWLFLICIGLAFLTSSLGIVRITLDYLKKIETEVKQKKESQNNV